MRSERNLVRHCTIEQTCLQSELIIKQAPDLHSAFTWRDAFPDQKNYSKHTKLDVVLRRFCGATSMDLLAPDD